MVAPRGMTSSATSGTSSSEECPPDTSRATAGDGSVPCSNWSTAMCAARGLTPYSGAVGGQLVDPVQGLAQREGDRLVRGHPDQQRPGQARSRGDGHGVDLAGP